MQVFGVNSDIDADHRGHRLHLSPRSSVQSRREQVQTALRYGDIEGVPMKRHFVNNRAPCESLSPRAAAVSVESVDIDSHRPKGALMTRTASEGILPFASSDFNLACEVNHGAWCQAARGRCLKYFEQALQADRYAKLIGRPHSESDKELNRTRLALEVEKNNKACWTLDAIPDVNDTDTLEDFAIDVDSERKHRLSTQSTTASEGSSASPETNFRCIGQQLSKEKIFLLNGKDPVMSKISRSIFAQSQDANIGSLFEESDTLDNLPLGLRRVVASLVPNAADLSENAMQDLRQAIGSSAQTIRESQGTRVARRACPPSLDRSKSKRLQSKP
jgi:hypothetical protein